jgi:hypothetical protein
LPEGPLERLALDLKPAKTKAGFQRVQCLWLRASLQLSADQVATAIGWHPNSVRTLWFANEVLKRLDVAEDPLVAALVALENDKELVASTTVFDWIINGL